MLIKPNNFIKSPSSSLLILFFFVSLVGKLLPHPPNIAPTISLSILSGIFLPKYLAYLLICGSNLIADLLLSYVKNYNLFSNWIIFTYSWFIAIIYISSNITLFNNKKFLILLVSGSFSFWAWTNFGVWLLDGMYEYSLSGILLCYSAALPFLKYSLTGDLCWGIGIWSGFVYSGWVGKSYLVDFKKL